MYAFLKYLQILSIDIMAGAICTAIMLNTHFSADISLNFYICLGLTIWLIYTVDHLIDSKKIITPLTPRHQFHQKHFKSIGALAFFVGMIDLLFIATLPLKLIIIGTLLGIVTLLYLYTFVLPYKSTRQGKELTIALLYSVGVGIVPISIFLDLGIFDAVDLILTLLLLALLALSNLFIISANERHIDVLQQQKNMHHSLNKQQRIMLKKTLILLILLINALSMGLLFIYQQEMKSAGILHAVLAAMSLCILLCFRYENSLKHHERYRLYVETMFIIPVVYMFFV